MQELAIVHTFYLKIYNGLNVYKPPAYRGYELRAYVPGESDINSYLIKNVIKNVIKNYACEDLELNKNNDDTKEVEAISLFDNQPPVLVKLEDEHENLPYENLSPETKNNEDVDKENNDEEIVIDQLSPPLTNLETRVARLKGALNLSRYAKRRIFYEFMCYKCFKKFDGEHQLDTHLYSEHNITPLVYFCCNKLIRPTVIDKHINYHVNLKRFTCPACNKKFLEKNILNSHAKRHCKKRIDCKICNVTGLTAYEYLTHTVTISNSLKHGMHKSNQEIECKKEGKFDPELQVYTCDLCCRKNKTKIGLIRHMRCHMEREQYVCEHCGFPASGKSGLKSHIESKHSDVKPEHCPHCNKAVKKLRSHILIHHDNSNPSVCTECGASFGNRRLLAVHTKKKHDHRKPWICNICNKAYKMKFQLTEHSYTHLSTYKYSCELCLFQVNYSRNMRAHWKAAHLEYYQEKVKERLQKTYGPSGMPKSMESNKGVAAIKLLNINPE